MGKILKTEESVLVKNTATFENSPELLYQDMSLKKFTN